MAEYQFIIVLDAQADDIVTEALYQVFQAGAVPIYQGASNIKKFLPGNNSLINVRDFDSIADLTDYVDKARSLLNCCRFQALTQSG